MDKSHQAGFTLIELIASLALGGVIVAVVGLAIVTGVRGYLFGQQNSEISQKATLINTRLFREFNELSEIDVANSNNACIRYKIATVSPHYRAIAHYDNRIDLKVAADSDSDCPDAGGPGNVLADRVNFLEIKYRASDGTIGNSPPAALEALIGLIVTFRLQRLDGEADMDFTFQVNPRNTGKLNGPGS